jgi:hypothetical protein
MHFILQRVQYAQPSVKFKDLCSRISTFVLSEQKPASVMLLQKLPGCGIVGSYTLKETPYLANYYPEHEHVI